MVTKNIWLFPNSLYTRSFHKLKCQRYTEGSDTQTDYRKVDTSVEVLRWNSSRLLVDSVVWVQFLFLCLGTLLKRVSVVLIISLWLILGSEGVGTRTEGRWVRSTTWIFEEVSIFRCPVLSVSRGMTTGDHSFVKRSDFTTRFLFVHRYVVLYNKRRSTSCIKVKSSVYNPVHTIEYGL